MSLEIDLKFQLLYITQSLKLWSDYVNYVMSKLVNPPLIICIIWL